MKLFKKKKSTNRSQIVHKKLSQEIEITDTSLNSEHLKTAQKVSTMDFSKVLKGAKIKDFLGSMRADYQKLVDKIDQTLAGALSIFQSTKDISNAKDAIADYKRKIKELDDKLAFLKGKINEASEKLAAKVKNWTNRKVWVLYLLASFELVANYGVYQLLGGGTISAIAISFISAFIIFWWGHITPKYVIQYGGKNPRKQLFMFSIFATPIFLLFFLFSKMRISSLILANPEMADVFVSSPLVPALINFFGYLIACYLVFQYRPSKQEMEAYKKFLLDAKAINDLDHQRETLIQEKNNQVPELQEKLTDHYNFLLLAQQLETNVKTRYEGCFQEFRGELYLRTNSKCNPLFTGNLEKDLPQLELKYQTIDKTKFELCEDLL